MTTKNDLILGNIILHYKVHYWNQPPRANSIKDTLESDGTLGKLKAKMRTKIVEILNNSTNEEKPEQPKETLLINELIRDYLSWSGYKYTNSIFMQECGLSQEPMSRSQLLEELGVFDTEESSKYSVLYGLVEAFKEDLKKNED